MSEAVHPETGYRYFLVIPAYDSFRDIRQMYARAATRLPWLEVLSYDGWARHADRLLGDPSTFAVVMGSAPDLPSNRKGRVATYYCEMVGPPETLIDNQRGIFERFVARAPACDLLLARTPYEQQMFERLFPNSRSALFPTGYEAEVFGKPDFAAPKTSDLVFYGFKAGRRTELLELLQRHLKHGIASIYGSYDQARHALLNSAKAIWNIPFSVQHVYGTFRIWEALSSSAPLITEAADTWPSVAGRHHLEVPTITPQNVEAIASQVDAFLDEPARMVAMARCAHEELARFTPERCLADYLVPASAAFHRAG